MDLATVGLFTYGVSAIWLAIALIALIVLLRIYTQTQMSGFLWLLFAVVVWPFLSRVMSMLMPMYIAQLGLARDRMLMATFGLSAVETIVGVVLLVIALLVLQQQLTARLFVSSAPVTASTTGLPTYRG